MIRRAIRWAYTSGLIGVLCITVAFIVAGDARNARYALAGSFAVLVFFLVQDLVRWRLRVRAERKESE